MMVMVVVQMIEMVGDNGPNVVLMDLVMILVSTSSDSGRVMKAVGCGSGSSSDNSC